HTLIFDDGACGVDTVAAITAAKTAVHSASDNLGLIEGTHSLRSFAHSSSFTTWICCDFFLGQMNYFIN
ncbi:MAG: hypothetical protein PV344_03185, partial [Anaplasma sp.]|nr:hypothetical protein [Anaplasma sp.]